MAGGIDSSSTAAASPIAGSTTAIGFLTAVLREPHGLFGGYLLLNPAGQPLEFHCTAPVKPSRIQQILYGPTLEPFLYGEQIGANLVSKSALTPLAVLVDQPAMLAVRSHLKVPAALVLSADASNASSGFGSKDELSIGQNRLAVASRFSDDRQLIASRLAELHDQLNLSEPFERIRGAIDEAVRTTASKAA